MRASSRPSSVTCGSVAGPCDEPALGEQPHDPVEGAGQRVGGGGDLLLQLRVVALDAQIALGLRGPWPPGSAICCATGCRRNCVPQRRQLRIDGIAVVARPPAAAAAPTESTSPRRPTAAPRPGHAAPSAGGARPVWATTSTRPAPTRPNSRPTKSVPPNGVRSAPTAAGRRRRGPTPAPPPARRAGLG